MNRNKNKLNFKKKFAFFMYSINIPLSYTLQSLNIILTSLTHDYIYNAVRRKLIFSTAEHGDD